MSVNPNHFAAIDLGSNSFHMIVVEYSHNQIKILDKHKEMIRLASGLNEQNELDEDIRQTAVECLQRFSQRLNTVPKIHIKAVGTNTLRRAANSSDFLHEASLALGHNIEVISGIEEARLIYLGVSHGLEDSHEKRLVMDIGGGSTEFIVGTQFNSESLNSLEMGCVKVSQRFFADGVITEQRLDQAIRHCEFVLMPYIKRINQTPWDIAIGASGTIKAIAKMVREKEGEFAPITLASMDALKSELVSFDHVDELSIAGLKPERYKSIMGGFAVLYASIKALQIKEMSSSNFALREGLIYDMIGRTEEEDVREKTVLGLIDKLHQDKKHLKRVSLMALALYEQTKEAWKLDNSDFDTQKLLEWAALLHEIGNSISYRKIQMHGAYLLEYSELAGFSQTEQKILSTLVLAHRRKVPTKAFDGFRPKKFRKTLMRLAILLRLSVLLQRDRDEHPTPEITVSDNAIRIKFDAAWMEQHSLTQVDLEHEIQYLKKCEIELSYEA